MDINLPGMSGTEAMKRLKRSKKTSSILVIARSANAQPQDVARGIEAGFDGARLSLAAKPVTLMSRNCVHLGGVGCPKQWRNAV